MMLCLIVIISEHNFSSLYRVSLLELRNRRKLYFSALKFQFILLSFFLSTMTHSGTLFLSIITHSVILFLLTITHSVNFFLSTLTHSGTVFLSTITHSVNLFLSTMTHSVTLFLSTITHSVTLEFPSCRCAVPSFTLFYN